MRRATHTSEAELRRMASAGLTTAQIAQATGIPHTMIRAACSVLGISSLELRQAGARRRSERAGKRGNPTTAAAKG